MKKLVLFIFKAIQKLLFIQWTGYDLNYKSINYVIGHYRLYELVKDVPGHIIELGTGSGRNSLIFGSIIKLNNQTNYKHVYGFDTFSGSPKNVLDSNKEFDPKSHTDFSFDDVKLRMTQNNLSNEVTLIKGFLPNSISKFLNDSTTQGFTHGKLKISLIYIDCNDYETAKNSLLILKEFLSKGSIIAIDENRLGGETKALVDFSDYLNLPIKQWQNGGVISSYLEVV